MIISAFIFTISYALYYKRKIKGISCIILPILAFYLSFVVTITVIGRIPSNNIQYNFKLFWSYQAIANGEFDLVSQVFWNVVLFIPIGILLMLMMTSKHRMLFSIVSGVLLSVAIEIMQLVFHRGFFEFDDIVHNTFGTVIGISLIGLVSVFRKKTSKLN